MLEQAVANERLAFRFGNNLPTRSFQRRELHRHRIPNNRSVDIAVIMREVISHADNSTPLNFGMKPLRAFRQLASFFRHPKRAHQKGVRQRPRPHVIRMQKLVLGDIKTLMRSFVSAMASKTSWARRQSDLRAIIKDHSFALDYRGKIVIKIVTRDEVDLPPGFFAHRLTKRRQREKTKALLAINFKT